MRSVKLLPNLPFGPMGCDPSCASYAGGEAGWWKKQCGKVPAMLAVSGRCERET